MPTQSVKSNFTNEALLLQSKFNCTSCKVNVIGDDSIFSGLNILSVQLSI